jgi:outer membrane protein assembly factor BamB
MNPPKLAGMLSTILGIFFLACSAEAQCVGGLDFTYCPAVDTIYLLTGASLGAFSVSERKVKWQTELPHETDESFLAPVATPDSVVISAGAPLTRIHAFDPATGKPSWHVETSADDFVSAGPYILFWDKEHWEGLTALDGKTGKIAWHHSGRRPGAIRFYASSGRVLLTNLFAIDAYSGRVLKRWPRDWEVSAAALTGGLSIIGTRWGGSPNHGKLAAYSGPSYETLWRRRDTLWTKGDPRERIVAGIAADANDLLVASYDADVFRPGHATLERVSAASGKTIWTREIACEFMLGPSPVALVQGLAIFAMADSRNSSVVQAFDAATGQQKWIVHTDRRLIDGPVCDSQHCFLGSVSNEVFMIDVPSSAQSWLALPKE